MTSRSDRDARPAARGRSGFSVFEMLVVLAVLAVTVAAAASLMRRPPEQIELRARAAELVDAAMAARLRALNEGRRVVFTPAVDDGPTVSDCADAGTPPHLAFHPDGSAEGGPICLALGGARMTVAADPLTGLPGVSEGSDDQ